MTGTSIKFCMMWFQTLRLHTSRWIKHFCSAQDYPIFVSQLNKAFYPLEGIKSSTLQKLWYLANAFSLHNVVISEEYPGVARVLAAIYQQSKRYGIIIEYFFTMWCIRDVPLNTMNKKLHSRYSDANQLRLFEFAYVGLQLKLIHNSECSLNPLLKREFLSIHYQ